MSRRAAARLAALAVAVAAAVLTFRACGADDATPDGTTPDPSGWEFPEFTPTGSSGGTGDAAPAADEPAATAGALRVRLTADDTGAPLAGVVVWARPVLGGADQQATTDADGRATIEGLAAGPVVVEPERPRDRADLARNRAWLAERPGEVHVVWPTLPRLRGRVVGCPDDVCGDLRVVALRAPDFEADLGVVRMPVAPDGTFDQPLPPGRYVVWSEPRSGHANQWTRAAVDDVDPALLPVVLRIEKGAVVTGTTVDRAGLPEGARVDLLPVAADGRPFRSVGGGRPATPGASYESGALPPGTAVDLWFRASARRDSEALAWGLVRGVAAPATDVQATLEAPKTLLVTVVDADGRRPQGRFTVLARPAGAGRDLQSEFATVVEASPNGVTEMRGLPPTDLDVLVGSRAQVVCTPEPVRVAADARTVTVRVVPTVTVSGTVSFADGRPVPDSDSLAYLGLQQDNANRVRTRRGEFVLEHVVPGRVRLAWMWGDAIVADLGEVTAPAAGVKLVLPAGVR